MGLFDGIAGQVLGSLMNNDKAGNAIQIITAIMNNPNVGGLQGLISSFQQNGLGHIIGSWLESGNNPLPVSPEQIQSVLGSPIVASVAEKVGLSPEMVTQQLSAFLPSLIAQFAKDGQLDKGDFLTAAMSLLGGLGKK